MIEKDYVADRISDETTAYTQTADSCKSYRVGRPLQKAGLSEVAIKDRSRVDASCNFIDDDEL